MINSESFRESKSFADPRKTSHYAIDAIFAGARNGSSNPRAHAGRNRMSSLRIANCSGCIETNRAGSDVRKLSRANYRPAFARLRRGKQRAVLQDKQGRQARGGGR